MDQLVSQRGRWEYLDLSTHAIPLSLYQCTNLPLRSDTVITLNIGTGSNALSQPICKCESVVSRIHGVKRKLTGAIKRRVANLVMIALLGVCCVCRSAAL